MFYFLFKRRVHILFLYWACKLGSWSCCSIYSFDISLSGNSRGNIYRLHKISWIMSPVLENKISEDKTVWIKQEFLYTLYDVPQYWYHSTLNHIFNVVWRGENKGKKQERLNFEPEYQADIKYYLLCFSISTKGKNNLFDHQLLIDCDVSLIYFFPEKWYLDFFKFRNT